MRFTFSGIFSLLLLAFPAQAQSFEVQTLVLELMNSGKYDSAEAMLTGNDPVSLRLRIELADRRGDSRIAVRSANQMLLAYQAGSYQTSGELAQAAFAAWYLGEWERANRIFNEASEKGNPSLSLYVDWGRLYLEKFNPGEAEGIFQDAVKAGPQPGSFPRWTPADAYLGLARAYAELSRPEAAAALARAVELDPDNLDLVSFQVEQLIKEENWEEASKKVQQGLEANPACLSLLELDCAISLFKTDMPAYEAKMQRVLDISPADADLFELLGDLSIPGRRLEDAIDFYSRALEKNPRQWTALASRGINYLRLGKEELGIRDLEEAYLNDPYNLWTVNTLRLVDSFKRFQVFETPHFRIRLHQKEAAVLRPYVEELLERSIASLEKRYRHKIEQIVTFEMFPDHEDFAVRTLGMPGLGALGATIGRIVAMDSPSARPRGKFHWGSTLWHELAHVVTLSLSKNRIPRWFTEGLSMMEERLGGPGWGDPLSLIFIRFYREDKLLPVKILNAGFIRPKSPDQITVSYLQAGLLCEMIRDNYGMDRIRDMLVAYGEGLTTEEVFQRHLGTTAEEIDRQLRQLLKEELDPYLDRLELPDPMPSTLEDLESAVKESPDNYFLNLATGYRYLKKKQIEEAIPFLEHALELFPWNTGDESPYAFLYQAYTRLDNPVRLADLLQRWWSVSPLVGENARRLAELKLATANDTAAAIRLLESAMYADPLDIRNHEFLGRLYLDHDQPEEAVREFEVVLALDPVDKASAHYQLALALSASGERERARRQVLYSLEIAPGFEEAQELLLELVRQ